MVVMATKSLFKLHFLVLLCVTEFWVLMRNLNTDCEKVYLSIKHNIFSFGSMVYNALAIFWKMSESQLEMLH